MKNAHIYIPVFEHAATYLDQAELKTQDIQFATGEVLDSVFLKMFKASWASPSANPLTAKSRIFFSVWINDKTLAQKRLCYNIHALKLRKLPGYNIQSRQFADRFRKLFAERAREWENVSVDFGPLTLMEGWVNIDPDHFQHVVATLGNEFFSIAPMIDETLAFFRK